MWTSTRKRAINKETISQLSRLDLSVVNACPKSYLELARDIFMFSYLTAGINFKDIAFLKYANIENNRIYYVRHKTKKMLTFNLLPEARKILDKYSNISEAMNLKHRLTTYVARHNKNCIFQAMR